MEEGVSKYVVSVWRFDVGFWEDENVKVVVFHGFDQGVHFA